MKMLMMMMSKRAMHCDGCAHQNVRHNTQCEGKKIDSLKGHLEFGTVAHIYWNLILVRDSYNGQIDSLKGHKGNLAIQENGFI